MQYYTSITKKGQMTLPKEVREQLGVYIPSKVILEVDKKNKTIKVKKMPDIADFAGIVNKISKVKPKDPVKLRELMGKNYERI